MNMAVNNTQLKILKTGFHKERNTYLLDLQDIGQHWMCISFVCLQENSAGHIKFSPPLWTPQALTLVGFQEIFLSEFMFIIVGCIRLCCGAGQGQPLSRSMRLSAILRLTQVCSKASHERSGKKIISHHNSGSNYASFKTYLSRKVSSI